MADRGLFRPGDLTSRERECLRLVLTGMKSKDIAVSTGLTPGTVDQYIKRGMQAFGAASRYEAAVMLRELEAGDGLQNSELQPQRLVAPATPRPPEEAGDRAPDPSPKGGSSRSLPAPFPTEERPWNDLTTLQRNFWIIAIALGSALAAAGLLKGSQTIIQALSGLF